MLAYWDRHVVAYYVKAGRPTSEQDNIRQALRFARRIYGGLPAREFGPQALKAVRQAMVEAGRCRNLINKDVNRIRALFRWAVEQELIPVTVLQALQAVAALRAGRSGARETVPVGPVPMAYIRAALPHLSPQVASMVELQRATGARPCEVITMRPCDITIDENEGIWIYRPAAHKTEHLGRERKIYFGPRAQGLLRPWLDRVPDAYCFSPAEVVAARNARCRTRPRSPGASAQADRARTPTPKRAPGLHYTRHSYRTAIQRACRKAGVPLWHPHQLRHNAATEIRKEFGLEAAQLILGHGWADVTQVYAERDETRAKEIAATYG